MKNSSSEHKRMACEERQVKSRARKIRTHDLANDMNPIRRNTLWPREFTLVELLVVIAIIAVLASMLLPALKGAKDMSKTIKCVNNEKQMYTITLFYVEDNSQWAPYNGGNWKPCLHDYFPPGQKTSGASQISGPDTIFYCPAAIEIPVSEWIFYNCAYTAGDGVLLKIYVPSLKSPSTTRWIFDGQVYPEWHYAAGTWNGPRYYRHNHGCNIVYWDGHVDLAK